MPSGRAQADLPVQFQRVMREIVENDYVDPLQYVRIIQAGPLIAIDDVKMFQGPPNRLIEYGPLCRGNVGKGAIRYSGSRGTKGAQKSGYLGR